MTCFHSSLRRLAIGILTLALASVWYMPTLAASEEALKIETEQVITSSADVLNARSYVTYLQTVPAVAATQTVQIDPLTFSNYNGEQPSTQSDPAGDGGQVLLLPDTGSVTWRFTVEQAGLYELSVSYYPIEGTGNSIMRQIWIDDALPFRESAEISLERRWISSSDRAYDVAGNELRPVQMESAAWMEKRVEDLTGSAGRLSYYLTAGEHTVTLVATREPMLLRQMSFLPPEILPTYEQVSAEYAEKGYTSASDSAATIIEAESATAKSDQTMYPLVDRTTSTVTPYSATVIRYNTIGSTQWKTMGQWIEWTVDVPQTGLYHIGTHYQQNLKTAGASARELTIDGKIPFAEAAQLMFPYDRAWKSAVFADEEGVPFAFYLEKGIHTIRLRVTLGPTANIASEVDDLITALNAIYRKIVVITGTSPDPYRNYEFEKQIPDVLKDMGVQSERLKALEANLQEQLQTGIGGVQAIRRLWEVLDMMTDDTDEIRDRLTTYRDYISSLATWRNELVEQPLLLDSLYLWPPGKELPRGEAGFFELVTHYLRQFFYSFVSDYNTIGSIDAKTTEQIKVWMATGRDQAQILKQLINDRFTPNEQIGVQLQLVSADSLLPALVARNQPDAYLGLAQAEPVNLALRDALADLSEMEGFDEVKGWFSTVAMDPFRFEGGTYALPETQTYPMLFYRKDILRELNISTDSLTTWNGLLKEVLPILQKNSLTFGMTANIQSFLTMYAQKGQSLYTEDLSKVRLDTAEAVETMQLYTMLYADYELNLAYDFANRFRSGELPVAIADYTAYNQLSVFAPEIKGLWGMMPVPGTETDEGINHTAVSTMTGSVMFAGSENKNSAWTFLKWWVSADVQSAYGKDLESLVGSAARYNTANLEAMESVQWDADIRDQLYIQRQALVAYPEVPGGYYTSRNFDFAFRDILYSDMNVRDALIDATREINREIQKKRDEYGLN